MDQKNEMERVVYGNRIAKTISLWNDTQNFEGGRIIGKDGTVFAKTTDGRLVQVVDPKDKSLCRAVKFVTNAVTEQGLIPRETKGVETAYTPVTEYVTEL